MRDVLWRDIFRAPQGAQRLGFDYAEVDNRGILKERILSFHSTL